MYVNGLQTVGAVIDQSLGGVGVQYKKDKSTTLGGEFLSNIPVIGPMTFMVNQHNFSRQYVMPTQAGAAFAALTSLVDAGNKLKNHETITSEFV